MRRPFGEGVEKVRRSPPHRPTGKFKRIARSLFKFLVSMAEAQAAGGEPEDYLKPEIMQAHMTTGRSGHRDDNQNPVRLSETGGVVPMDLYWSVSSC